MKKLLSITIPSIANNNILSNGGVIYLPFQISVFSQIVAHYNTLRENYSISFIGCTESNTLWSCTQKISATEMLDVFDFFCQEEQYCTITEQEIKQKTWPNVCSDDLLDIFKHIDDPKKTRFIQLNFAKGDGVHLGYTGLRKHRPRTTTRSYSKRKTKMKQPLVHNKRQYFIPTTTLNNLQQYINKNWPKGNDTKDNFCQGIHQTDC